MTDPREAEWREYCAERLAAGRCPDSGEVLHMKGDGPAGSASCDMCDCFGYDPEQVKVHSSPLRIARYKLTRRTCRCGRRFLSNTRWAVCDECEKQLQVPWVDPFSWTGDND